MQGAVAVDLGATSVRFAAGHVVDGRIEYEVIKQIPNIPVERDDRVTWNMSILRSICDDAADYAVANFDEATLAIDGWGVDHGFIDEAGKLAAEPVCYRDRSHLDAFEKLAPHRARLYELTGCQHQPFNTICQLLARGEENPQRKHQRWMILPDLLGFLLGGEPNYELTQASTTQLLGLDDRWAKEAFDLIGWPAPDLEPALPGRVGGEIRPGVRLVSVGSHDTASAVCGFGTLDAHQAFLNVGTWSLFGCLLDRPLASADAEAAGFTNERAVDGRVRFLKNIPGFYVVTRVHEELQVPVSVPEWLRAAERVDERLDLVHESLFNPDSMVNALKALTKQVPTSSAKWAGLVLHSLAWTVAQQPKKIEELTGRRITELRVGGGGSQSEAFCTALAEETGLEVVTGPAEATVVGNLAMQFLASGVFADEMQMRQAIDTTVLG